MRWPRRRDSEPVTVIIQLRNGEEISRHKLPPGSELVLDLGPDVKIKSFEEEAL